MNAASTKDFDNDAAPAVSFAISKFKSKDRLSKRFELVNGVIIKHSGVSFSKGEASTHYFAGSNPADALSEFGRTLDSLGPNEAIGLGVAANGKEINRITTDRDAESGRDGDAIARTKDAFAMPDGLNAVLLDFDGMTDGRNRLFDIHPAFGQLAMPRY